MRLRTSLLGVLVLPVALAGCGGGGDDGDTTAKKTDEATPALSSKVRDIVAAASKDTSETGRFQLTADVKVVPGDSAPPQLKTLIGKPINLSVKGALGKNYGDGTATAEFAGQKLDFEVRVPDVKDKVFVKYNTKWYGVPASEFNDSSTSSSNPLDLGGADVQKSLSQAQTLLSNPSATVVKGETVSRDGEKQWRWTVKGTAATWKKLLTEESDDPMTPAEADKLAPVLADKLSATLAVNSEDLTVREIAAKADAIDVATITDDPQATGMVKSFSGSFGMVVTDIGEDIPKPQAPEGPVGTEDELSTALSTQLQGLLMGALGGMGSMTAPTAPTPG